MAGVRAGAFNLRGRGAGLPQLDAYLKKRAKRRREYVKDNGGAT